MATELYNGHLIASISRYDDEHKAWTAKLIISWREGYCLYYRSFEPVKLSGTLAEAVADGLLMGRRWVDKKV
ncbi:MAG: hypothetical protein ACREQ7_11840 [Candidatus Binatia bacterium]